MADLKDLEKEHFDAVIVGTGLVESILSAALALAGKKVLHLDRNDFYGDADGTLTLAQVDEWSKVVKGEMESCRRAEDDELVVPRESEFAFGNPVVEMIEGQWKRVEEDRMCKRGFNLDLSPRMILCRGVAVDTLLRAGVAKYLEFKPLDDALMLTIDGSVIRVPCSKAAVFKSRDISMGEKRQLMKFLQMAMDRATLHSSGGEQDAVKFRNEAHLNQGRSLSRPQNKADKSSDVLETNEENGDFVPFLEKTYGMSPKLRDSILYAVALSPREPVPGDMDVKSGLGKVEKFLGGLGRFGKTAFLCSLYGSSEVSQAFCRLSSVNGTLFILRQQVDKLILDEAERKVKIVQLDDGTRISTNQVIASPRYELHQRGDASPAKRFLVRKILVANGPIVSLTPQSAFSSDLATSQALLQASAVFDFPTSRRAYPDMARCLLVVPPNNIEIKNGSNSVFVVQLDNSVEAAGPGYFLIHLTMEHDDPSEGSVCLDRAAQVLLQHANSTLDKTAKPKEEEAKKILQYVWSVKFHRQLGSQDPAFSNSDSIVSVGDVGTGIDCVEYFHQAEKIFSLLYPNEPFLPSEQDRKVPLHSPGIEDDDQVSSVLSRVKIPQPVDLQWYSYLGGKLSSDKRVCSILY